ncbi:MAG: bacillithiol biosynthesis cysteine-adding enzyme BshC [Luteitalea sp.]|nr:bacillithiol biosynthesis cysteine-adding enzyme BshC [Luteitalea sp.]
MTSGTVVATAAVLRIAGRMTAETGDMCVNPLGSDCRLATWPGARPPSGVATDARTDVIPWHVLSGVSTLFLAYTSSFPKVARFYGTGGWSLPAIEARAVSGVSGGADRGRLVDILADQNRQCGAGEAVTRHLALLSCRDTVAIVTGQQPGLFTGPLYTVYKALTAVKIAAALRARGRPAVSVFWIAADDHDLAEVDHCSVVSPQGKLVTVRHLAPGDEGRPVGNVPLTAAIDEARARLLAALPASALGSCLDEQLQDAYTPGTTLGAAFGRLLAALLAPYGVILLDPTDPRVKSLAAGLFDEVIVRTPEIAQRLVERSSTLVAAGYHAQLHVEPESAPFFLIQNGTRVALRQAGGAFRARHGDRRWPVEGMRAMIRDCPALFSPNASLRPLVQDTLLPTAAYIGGPAEVAYFAQLEPLYRLFGRSPTPIVPRASFTVLEHSDEKTLRTFQLEFADIVRGFETLWPEVVARQFAGETWRMLDGAERDLEEQWQTIDAQVEMEEPSLKASVSRCRNAMRRELAKLRSAYVSAQRARQAAAAERLQRTEMRLRPGGDLQERRLTIAHFLARYDASFLDVLYDAIVLDASDHRLLFAGPPTYPARPWGPPHS